MFDHIEFDPEPAPFRTVLIEVFLNGEKIAEGVAVREAKND